MTPESNMLATIEEVAVLQARPPVQSGDFIREFPGLEAAFRRSVKVHWLYPKVEGSPRLHPFRAGALEVHPVPFTLLDENARNGNWEWLQDPFLVVPGQQPIFIIPAQATIQDQLIVLALARSSGAQIKMANTYFEGGNTLWFQERLLMGKDTILQNKARGMGNDHWQVKTAIESDFYPVAIEWIGDDIAQKKVAGHPCGHPVSFQPFFHLDLFLMPAGINAKGQPRIALASVDLVDEENSPATERALASRMKDQLDRVAEQIRHRFQVETELLRIPLLVHLSRNQPRVFSTSNGLYESTPKGDRVLLPDFVSQAPTRFWQPWLKDFQAKVEERWRGKGVVVEWVENGFFEDVEKCGALHCRTKIIKRKQPINKLQ